MGPAAEADGQAPASGGSGSDLQLQSEPDYLDAAAAAASAVTASEPPEAEVTVMAATLDLSAATIAYNDATISYPVRYTLGFSTYIDGTDTDIVRDIAIDAEGNVYVTGGSVTFNLMPITNDYFDAGGVKDFGWFPKQDVFVQKYTPDGELQWTTRIGGVNYDRAYALEVDGNGSVYVAGRAGAGFYTTAGALQEDFGGNSPGTENRPYGNQDSFIAKLDAGSGQLDWSTYFGGKGGEIIRDIDIDTNGTIHIAQTYVTAPGGQHITADALNSTPASPTDDIYAQLSNDGATLLYGTYLGLAHEGMKGSNPSIIVDANGDINMMMMTDAPNAYTTPGAWRNSAIGGDDIYVVKFDGADGGRTIKAATYIGTAGDEVLETHNLAIDPEGNFIVSGETMGRYLHGAEDGFQPNTGGDNEGFITIISADGKEVLASTWFGGSGRDLIEGLVYTDDGILVTGTTTSTDLPVTDTTQFGGHQGGKDAFVALFSHDLKTLKYATYFGGGLEDEGRTSAYGPNGEIYLGGSTRSADLPILDAEQPVKSAWFAAGFLAQLEPGTAAPLAGSVISITASAKPDNGPAEAWVLVNGAIVGEIAVTADHALGETQSFTINAGKIINATDTLEIRYHNDLYNEALGFDRNLHLSEVAVDGAPLYFTAADLTAVHADYDPAAETITLASDGGAVFAMMDQMDATVISLTASADLYLGAPAVEILVNGQLVAEVSVDAERSQGEKETFLFPVAEPLAAGDIVELRYSNDLYGAEAGDRNLYFEALSIDGTAVDLSGAEIIARYGGYDADGGYIGLGSNGSALFDIV